MCVKTEISLLNMQLHCFGIMNKTYIISVTGYVEPSGSQTPNKGE